MDHQARFVVTHTDDWPSGARWVLGRGDRELPFRAVESWSEDPETPYPTEHHAGPTPSPSAPETVSEADARPAIVREMLAEIDAVGVLLRRLPQDQLDWSPHPSVPTLHTLSLRLVRIVARIDWILDLEYVETHFEPELPRLATVVEIVSTFTANAESVEALADALTADRLRAPWRLERNGEVIAQTSRGDAIRQFGLTPLVHHRGEASLLMTALGIWAPSPNPVWTFRDDPHWNASPQGAADAGDP